jgi:hypothetical protein
MLNQLRRNSRKKAQEAQKERRNAWLFIVAHLVLLCGNPEGE